jgi:hypothetical protein
MKPMEILLIVALFAAAAGMILYLTHRTVNIVQNPPAEGAPDDTEEARSNRGDRR